MIVRPQHSAGRNGLSLLEVLVALAIFLFSLVALSQLIDMGSDNARNVAWLGESSLLAQSRMAEVLAGSILLSSQSDAPCDEAPDWTWSMDAEPDNAPGLYRVKITVGRTRPDGTRFETVLNQMVIDPLTRGTTDGSDNSATDATGAAAAAGTTRGRQLMTRIPADRPAYTLLEVLLATAIAVLLMAALYVGMDVQLRAVQAGRESVNETALVRNLIARMSADAVGTITPIAATVAVSSTTEMCRPTR